jgi:hypothetical protein
MRAQHVPVVVVAGDHVYGQPESAEQLPRLLVCRPRRCIDDVAADKDRVRVRLQRAHLRQGALEALGRADSIGALAQMQVADLNDDRPLVLLGVVGRRWHSSRRNDADRGGEDLSGWGSVTIFDLNLEEQQWTIKAF